MVPVPKRLRPGTLAPVSGVYRMVGPRGGMGPERTVVRGEPLPPTPKRGMTYVMAGADDGGVRKASMGQSTSHDETDYLLSNPENAQFLANSIREADTGRVVYVDPREIGIEG